MYTCTVQEDMWYVYSTNVYTLVYKRVSEERKWLCSNVWGNKTGHISKTKAKMKYFFLVRSQPTYTCKI